LLNIVVGVVSLNPVTSLVIIVAGDTVAITVGINSTSVGARDGFAFAVSTEVARVLVVVPVGATFFLEVLIFCQT